MGKSKEKARAALRLNDATRRVERTGDDRRGADRDPISRSDFTVTMLFIWRFPVSRIPWRMVRWHVAVNINLPRVDPFLIAIRRPRERARERLLHNRAIKLVRVSRELCSLFPAWGKETGWEKWSKEAIREGRNREIYKPFILQLRFIAGEKNIKPERESRFRPRAGFTRASASVFLFFFFARDVSFPARHVAFDWHALATVRHVVGRSGGCCASNWSARTNWSDCSRNKVPLFRIRHAAFWRTHFLRCMQLCVTFRVDETLMIN